MENDKHMVFTAKNVNEILYHLKTVFGIKIIGGSTYLGSLPEKSLSVRNIPELSVIDKHERYIDFGPAVILNDILHLGTNFLPQVLYDAILSIATHTIRNMATLGGNIMAQNTHLSLVAPLLALDTSLKFKTAKSFEVIPYSKFTEIPQDAVLVSIRIPTEDWNVAIFRRLGPSHKISNESCSFCFLAKTEKNILINLKMCFSGPFVFTCKELENKYLGIRLPLSKQVIEEFISIASENFDIAAGEIEYSPLIKQQFINLLAYSLHELT